MLDKLELLLALAKERHFGRAAEGDMFPWERLDLVEDLKAAVAD